MFYHYGEIRAIKVVPRQQCAFVEFTTRDAAQRAAKAKYNNCVIKVRNRLGLLRTPRELESHLYFQALTYLQPFPLWQQGVKLAVNWSKDVKNGSQVCDVCKSMRIRSEFMTEPTTAV